MRQRTALLARFAIAASWILLLEGAEHESPNASAQDAESPFGSTLECEKSLLKDTAGREYSLPEGSIEDIVGLDNSRFTRQTGIPILRKSYEQCRRTRDKKFYYPDNTIVVPHGRSHYKTHATLIKTYKDILLLLHRWVACRKCRSARVKAHPLVKKIFLK